MAPEFPIERPVEHPQEHPDSFPPQYPAAAGVRIVEDWEDKTDLSGWGGNTGGHTNEADSTLEGSRNVRKTDTGGGISTNTGEASQGSAFKIDFYLPSGVANNFIYFGIHGPAGDGGGSNPDSYQVLSNEGGSNFELYESDASGNRTQLAGVNHIFSVDQVYTQEVKHRSDGDVEGRLYNSSGSMLESLGPATPSAQHSAGDIYVYADESGTRWDNVREVE